MKILSIDTSSNLCSVAILDNSSVLYETTSEETLTHSQRLMPMIEESLHHTHLSLSDIDLYACCTGPGSFTGIRIGISTIKAFIDVYSKPSIGVNSLESLANSIDGSTFSYVIPLLDAKNGNIYGGIFQKQSDIVTPIHDLFASTIEDAIQKFQFENLKNIIFVGDGSILYQEILQKNFPEAKFAVSHKQNAIFIGKVAIEAYLANKPKPVEPLYLKKSQAERMLEEKKNEYKN